MNRKKKMEEEARHGDVYCNLSAGEMKTDISLGDCFEASLPAEELQANWKPCLRSKVEG